MLSGAVPGPVDVPATVDGRRRDTRYSLRWHSSPLHSRRARSRNRRSHRLRPPSPGEGARHSPARHTDSSAAAGSNSRQRKLRPGKRRQGERVTSPSRIDLLARKLELIGKICQFQVG